MPSRRRFLGATIATLAGGIPAAGLGEAGRPLRIGAITSDTYGEAYYSQDLGLFKRAGLDVEITTLTNGTAILTAVLGGALDIGISNTVAIATAVIHGFPVGFIAGGALYLSTAPTTVLCVDRGSPSRSAKDLEGKTVAVSALRDMNAAGTRAWLTENGADVAKVQFIEMAFPEMAPALRRGTVAAATIPEPQLTDAKNDVRIFAKFFDVIGKRFMNGGWFSTPDYVKKNPETVKRFVEVIYTTAKWANAHHSESAAILSKYSKVGLETTRSMTRAVYSESLDPRLIQPSIDVAFKYKLLDRAVNAGEIVVAT
jgi:NitT/TauT family transport system substrate-binding protein